MADFQGIPIITSGSKYKTDNGFNAIKNGIKKNSTQIKPNIEKPSWLKAKIPGGKNFNNVKKIVKTHSLSTVCEESFCPNIGECWSNGTATIMLMGSVCTRACKFCAVDTGNPKGWLDVDEPSHAANSVKLMDLNYVVLTSVDRDDIEDGGAQHYASCINAIKDLSPKTTVEALTPDFSGKISSLQTLLNSGIEIFAQNLETVKRLTHYVRDIRAGYEQTLNLLFEAKKIKPDIITKTSLMVGIGEKDSEIKQTLNDLIEIGVDIVTIGQYLRPTMNHLPVDRYVHPKIFNQYRDWGMDLGFMEVVSGPLVRSSYRADRVFEKNNVGL
ncbi:MAG: lipoyl synthase [Gammaproteobacteria bacterium TMED78]|nr:MAG: lipoyl synthase [Gammaproteobacteria bacterium TMED78]|tara:strand:+ start:12105 stop:13088 length:984 start_codon:yes stop_codon:yes gene_type:complete